MNSLPGRESRRDQVLNFFLAHMGWRFPTSDMHIRFGSAFRSRTSELNRDPGCPIVICNHTERSPDAQEVSFYWAESKCPQRPLFPWSPCDQAPERHRDDG